MVQTNVVTYLVLDLTIDFYVSHNERSESGAFFLQPLIYLTADRLLFLFIKEKKISPRQSREYFKICAFCWKPDFFL
jgi:hypothetical protein